jgi:hypothetical protein
LVSIILSVRWLALARDLPLDRRAAAAALAVFIACAGFYFWQGSQLEANMQLFGPGPPFWVSVVSLSAALLSALLVIGWSRGFAALLLLGLAVTSGGFNPLSIGFPDWRTSELGTLIHELTEADRREGKRPALWLSYGGPAFPYNGVVVQAMGARAITGGYGHPQLEFWKQLDPEGTARSAYNRVAMVRLMPSPLSTRQVRIELLDFHRLVVYASPLAPELRDMDARYVLAFGRPRGLAISTPPFERLQHSQANGFTLWRLPPSPLEP